MRKSFLMVVLGVVYAFGGDLSWAKNYDEAKKQALSQGKLVMVVLTQEGCDMCEYMKSVVFKNPDVMMVVESRFVPVEIDISKGKAPFKAYGTPTIYFANGKGEKVGRQIVGAAKPEVFTETIKKIQR